MLHGKCKKELEKLREEIEALEKEIEKLRKSGTELREENSTLEDKLVEMAKLAQKYKDACAEIKAEYDLIMKSAPQSYAIFYRRHPGGKPDEIDVFAQGQLIKIFHRIKGIRVDDLKCGWEIILNKDGNAAVSTTKELWRWGRQVSFVAMLSDSLILVGDGDSSDIQQCVLAPDLKTDKFKKGDLLLNCGGLIVKVLPKTEGADHEFESISDLDFDKVGGLSKQVNEIKEALLPFILKEVYMKELKGEEMPRGILLDGPPGCGKTHMARVIASRLARERGKKGCFMALVSTKFINKYVGTTEERIREVFNRAKEKAQETGGLVVIFIDEIDALVRSRENAMDKEPWKGDTVAQFNDCMNGIDPLSDVFVIGATNFKEAMDPAVLRRFTVHIHIPRPDRKGAHEILSIYLHEHLPFAKKYFSENIREFTDHFGTGERELVELNSDLKKISKHFVDTVISRIFYCGPAKKVILKTGKEEEIELTVDNKIEYLEDGKLRVTYLKDHISGDMLKNLVEKARRIALARCAETLKNNSEPKLEMFKRDFFEAVDAEYLRIATSLKAIRTDAVKEKGNIGFTHKKENE